MESGKYDQLHAPAAAHICDVKHDSHVLVGMAEKKRRRHGCAVRYYDFYVVH